MANKHGQTLDITLARGELPIGIKIAEPPGVTSDNLPLSTWGASYILANELHTLDISAPSDHEHLQHSSILDLGAGTGLVGISASLLLKQNAILTDLPTILPGVAANISVNAPVLSKAGLELQTGMLDWTDPSSLTVYSPDGVHAVSSIILDSHKFPVILAADTVYDPDHPALLSSTVTTWLARTADARFVLCYPLRMAYLDIIRDLWDSLGESGLNCVKEGQRQGDDPSWDEEAPYEWSVWAWKCERAGSEGGKG
nr:hypothetical protein B0A51_14747 [Rachicladosporium sp. CCFEE 5018]